MSLQYGDTPLHKASINGHKAVVEVLLKAGADHSMKSIVSIFQCILSSSLISFIIIYNNNTSTLVSLQYNDTPLHKASGNGHKAIVEVLLKADAITNSVNKFIQSRISFMYCKNMYENQQCNINCVTGIPNASKCTYMSVIIIIYYY